MFLYFSPKLQGTDRITRIDSDPDLQSRATRFMRRRLAPPGPTPLRSEVVEEVTQNIDPEQIEAEVEEDNQMLALVRSAPSMENTDSTMADGVGSWWPSTWMEWGPSLAFFIRIVSLIVPCSPYVCSTFILYPLLGLACADVFLYNLDPIANHRPASWKRTVVLTLAHLLILLSAHHLDVLCPYNYSQVLSRLSSKA